MKRDLWVDYTKNIACVLVVCGHFYQSMVASQIVPETTFYRWFIQTIYYFHVPLFFICSGYLFQKYSRDGWARRTFSKVLSLGVPYVVFTFISLLLKKAAGDGINRPEGGILETLLVTPMAPYWFLYVLTAIFIMTPLLKSKRAILALLLVSLLAKLLAPMLEDSQIPYVITQLMHYEVWFAIGASISYFGIEKRIGINGILSAILFVILSVIVVATNVSNAYLSFALGLIACQAIVSASNSFTFPEKITDVLTRYNFPIFLMHTICAAGVRILLLKLQITNSLLHIAIGLMASFLGPIAITQVLASVKYCDFLLYPMKYIGRKTKHTV
ncbi:MAG: acyltransferase [Clostridiales bacterium]|nr:acyltransferase [Clostridiales bacterium]